MRALLQHLHTVALTLWVGGLWAIGYIAAPVLFSALPDRVLAGDLAGRLFTAIAVTGLVCGAYSLMYRASRGGLLRDRGTWIVLLMMALVAAGQFYVTPILAAIKAQALPQPVMESADVLLRSRFRQWHGISSVLYLVVSLLGAALVCIERRAPR